MGRVSDFFSEQGIVLDGQKRTKMVALDRKVEEIEAERDRLKTENQNLKAQVGPLEREVQRLKDHIKQQEAPSSKLDEFKERLLFAISKGRDATTDDIASVAKKSEEAILFHLEEMMTLNLIGDRYDIEGRHWYLKQEGRRYLDKIGKLG